MSFNLMLCFFNEVHSDLFVTKVNYVVFIKVKKGLCVLKLCDRQFSTFYNVTPWVNVLPNRNSVNSNHTAIVYFKKYN